MPFLLFTSGVYDWIPSTQNFIINNYNYVGPAWYLSSYILFILLFPFIKKTFDSNLKYGIIISCTLFLFTGIFFYYFEPYAQVLKDLGSNELLNFLRFGSVMHLSSFLLGVSAGYIRIKLDYQKIYTYLSWISIILFVGMISFKIIPATIIPALPFAIIILFISLDNTFITKFLGNKIFRFLGAISFPLYLIHFPIWRAYQMYCPNGSWNMYLLLTLCCATIIHVVYEKKIASYLILKFKK